MSTETTIREKPILFSGEMIRAILRGEKTQARRVMKPPPPGMGAVEAQEAEEGEAIARFIRIDPRTAFTREQRQH